MYNYAILINSCDAYADAWNPFFRILEKTWPEAKQFNIYLNTEKKDYKDTFFNVQVINCLNENIKWGGRLIHVLSKIQEDYVLFLMEDFFFEKNIDYSIINCCYDYLKNNDKIACFCFTSPMECLDKEYCKKHSDKQYPKFIKRKQFGYYKYNATPSLWNKKHLFDCTLKSDSPWEWEFFGNLRTWFSKTHYYGWSINEPLIFEYDHIHGGAIHRGKWVGYKMKELEVKYGISIDMSQRDVEDDWLLQGSRTDILPRRKRIKSIIRNRIKILTSIFYSICYRVINVNKFVLF